jgi:peptidoglycan hydrolase-like amidase
LKLKLAASIKALPAPLVFSPGAAPLAVGKRAYRGTLRVTGGKAVRIVNVVGLEPYLWGVVPSEMPDTWPRRRSSRRRSWPAPTR